MNQDGTELCKSNDVEGRCYVTPYKLKAELCKSVRGSYVNMNWSVVNYVTSSNPFGQKPEEIGYFTQESGKILGKKQVKRRILPKAKIL